MVRDFPSFLFDTSWMHADTAVLVYVLGVMAEGLANDGISDDRRAALAADGGSQEVMLRVLGSKTQLVKWLLYGLVLWLLKGSLLHFFAIRLTVCHLSISNISYSTITQAV